MTAEIAVLNKGAIALAADSAMTVAGTGKSYPVNKLFALSRWHPVGVMIYNNAEFMEIPWETLVKMYRLERSQDAQPTIRDYRDDFLDFISGSNICSEAQQIRNLFRIANELFYTMKSMIKRRHQASSVSDDDADALRSVAEHLLVACEEIEPATALAEIDCASLVHEHREPLRGHIAQCFGESAADESNQELLLALLTAMVKSTRLSRGHSGVVIAGFGEEELFPSLVHVELDGMIGGALKVIEGVDYDIARDGLQGAIAPFAQREMVIRFMDGVDPVLLDYLRTAAATRFRNLASTLLGNSGAEDDSAVAALAPAIEALSEGIIEDLRGVCRERFAEPILAIVQHLPKEELAVMAEALVSLTSLKRRVSEEQESVGGPIDVAVISKGDGFIWSKRKHYFDPKFNSDFLARTAKLRHEPALEAS